MLKHTPALGGVLLLAAAGLAAVAPEARHPRLVSLEAARCSTCHGTLLRGMASVHPPAVEDCLSCHEAEITDERTTVTLSGPPPELCLACHDDKARAAGGDVAAPHAPVADTCLNCHDPHGTRQKRLLLEAVPGLCLGCHDVDELQTKHGNQLTENIDCLSCHDPHGNDIPRMLRGETLHPPFGDGECTACHRKPFAGRVRLVARGARICTACHGEMVKPDAVSVHPALDRTRNRQVCVACHDPHMSATAALTRRAGPALCAGCHPGVVAGAEGPLGHAAAAEDCTTCHRPHGADEPHLLASSIPGLCLECHDAADEELRATHLGAGLEDLDCVGCHTPHGDGNEKLLARTVHPPVLEGCDTCHEGTFDRLVDDGASSLCLACHDDVGEAASSARYTHAALEMAPCTQCHNPHASAQDRLVKERDGRECLACHDDMGAGKDEVAHGVIALLGCRACHEPHGGGRKHLLREETDALCLGCHDSSHAPSRGSAEPVRVLGRYDIPADVAREMATLVLSADGTRNHPVTNHRVLGTPSEEELARNDARFEGELGCLTCHDPHKGPSRLLLRWGAKGPFEACVQCHPK